MNAEQRRALDCAIYYRRLGLAPLPSRSDRKAPAMAEYAHFHTGAAIPDDVYTESAWNARNIQIITGAKPSHATKLAVVDLDGPEARAAWKAICEHHGHEPASPWVCETGSGGMHLYYRLPDGMAECPSGLIWGLWDTFGGSNRQGGWAKHKEIRILADGCLAVAPPSIHVETGKPYRFLDGFTPRQFRLPEIIPDWVLAMPRLTGPLPPQAPKPEPPKFTPAASPGSGAFYTRDQVLAAIPDKVAVARSWGLAFDRERPNPNGWCACYVPGREEPGRSSPSGSFHAFDGVLQDRRDNTTVAFFDLGALLQPGLWATWMDCKDWCAERFLGGSRTPTREPQGGRAYGGFGRPA